jgi:Tfp pilus assembly protein PilO
MKKIKLQPREKIIIALAVVAAMVYGFLSYWYNPHAVKIADAKNKLATTKSQISAKKDILTKAPALTARKPETDAKAVTLQQQLPSVDSIPSVLDDLKSLLEAGGASVSAITVDKASAQKGLDSSIDFKSIKVNFSAPYTQAFNVIKDIETNTKRTYTVSDLTLGQTNTGISGNMTVQVYFSKTALPGYEYKPFLETTGKSDPFAQ